MSFFFVLTLTLSYQGQAQTVNETIAVLKRQVFRDAAWALKEAPVTITSSVCARSAGDKHYFYSEGDYWWPDPQDPDGPYIQRDGMTNPENFVDHRKAMIRLSWIIGALSSAYILTKNEKYVLHACDHLKAWFVDSATLMNPSLVFAQAIKGKVTGRGIGIIDTIHLMEVAQGIRVMEQSETIDRKLLASVKAWFAHYLQWLMTHSYGKDEMNAGNNHGTCWVMQVATFATLVGNESALQFCRDRYRKILMPEQMDPNGSFPRELRRTKPYGYSLFNLDAMVMVCHILSNDQNDLWSFQTSDGRNIRKAVEFLSPFVKQKKTWPYAKDVMYWDDWPIAHPFLLMAAHHFNNREWFETWKSLDHSPRVDEVLRNLPVRYPLIWLNN
jgi:hypothetical protein